MQAHIVFAFFIGLCGLLNIYKIFKSKKNKFQIQDLFLILFIIFFLFSFFFSTTKNYGLLEVIGIIGGFIVYFLTKNIFDKKTQNNLINVTIYIATLSTLIGFWAYIAKPFERFAGSFQDFRESFSAYPNAYSDFLILISPFLIWKIFDNKNIKWKIFYSILAILNLTGFILAESQGAMIVLIGMMGLTFIYFIFTKFKIKKLSIIILIFLTAFALNFGFKSFHKYKFPEINLNNLNDNQVKNLEQNVSENERLDFWKGSIKMMQSNDYSYIFGYGPYSFKFVYPQYQQKLLALSDHPHNIFLKIAVENGIFAVAFFILFLVFILIPKLYFWLKVKFKKTDKIKLLIFLSLIGFLTHQLIDYNLNFTSNIILFWFLLGITSHNIDPVTFFSIQNSKFKIQNFIPIFYILYSIFLLSWSIHDGYYSYIFQNARAFDQANNIEMAKIYYNKSENIWLKRDLDLSYAQLLAKSKNEDDLKKSYKIFKNAIYNNFYNARTYNDLGKLIFNNKNLFQDEQYDLYFSTAIQRDPKNNLEYYYNELLILNDENFNNRYLTFIKIFLSDYLSQLRLNAHNTILTDNPKYAIMIADKILEKLKIDCRTTKNEFCDLRTNLIHTKMLEEEKIKIENVIPVKTGIQ